MKDYCLIHGGTYTIYGLVLVCCVASYKATRPVCNCGNTIVTKCVIFNGGPGHKYRGVLNVLRSRNQVQD